MSELKTTTLFLEPKHFAYFRKRVFEARKRGEHKLTMSSIIRDLIDRQIREEQKDTKRGRW